MYPVNSKKKICKHSVKTFDTGHELRVQGIFKNLLKKLF